MYANSGYLKNSKLPLKDKTQPLIVSGCGIYRLNKMKKLPTWRPRGRIDWQLLYVTSGKVHFYFDDAEYIVTPGHMVLYQPKQEQKYDCFGEDKPEIFWVHFTGNNVKNILKSYKIPLDKPVFYTGASSLYAYIFKDITNELQSQRLGFKELTAMYLRQLFLLIERARCENKPMETTFIQEEMEYACRYFNDHYNEFINIEEYTRSRGMSVSWFQRKFKQFTDYTPIQYILHIRMNNAAIFLETTDYSVSQIASAVGYDDPLYFSRLFHKHKGISPSEYRNIQKIKGNITAKD